MLKNHESFFRKKISKAIRNNYLSTKNVWQCWYKISYPKTSHKLFKTIGKDEKLGSNTSLYRDTQKVKFFKRKNWEHALKGYASTYDVEIVNSFNPEIQLNDTESAIKSKVIELLS